MTERERLIELINQFSGATYMQNAVDSGLVDFLLKSDIIVPPCKIGNTVWWIDQKRVVEMVCVGFLKTHKKMLVSIARNTNVFTTHYYVEWNVDVFSTKEKAQKILKMKGAKNNDNL